jgi:peptide/nickel transport system substrate-binding protein
LRDVRVRRAIAYAIDRESLVKAKLGGHAQLARSFVPIAHWAFDATLPLYAFDPNEARELLDAAGYAADSNGVRMHVTLRCGNDRFRQSIARAISAMLRDVGIDADLRVTEPATLISDLDRGLFDLTMLQIPEVIEPHVLSWFFASDKIPGEGREGANRWRFSSAELDTAFEHGRSTVVRSERIAVYRRVQRILSEQLPVIPLWHEDVMAVHSKRAASFRVPRDGRFATLAR